MSLINRLFGQPPEEPSGVFLGMRTQALSVRAQDLELTPDPAAPIHGVLMETGTKSGVATLVIMGDGTVSLYTSFGAGLIGGGEHESVRTAGAEMLEVTNKYAADYIAVCQATTAYPLPDKGEVFFYLLTSTGVYQARCLEAKLAERADPFANLFVNCHAVMTELRLLDEERRRKQ